jgi:hypothetical protein
LKRLNQKQRKRLRLRTKSPRKINSKVLEIF